MAEERYWFEDVPEERRYWFLMRWGTPRSAEDQQIGEEVIPEAPPGVDPVEFQEDLGRAREVMRREAAVGYAPGALDPPWWTDIEERWEHDKEPEFVTAPQLYAKRERAEEQLRRIDREPEDMLKLVERHGWEDANEAFDNTASLRVMWVDRGTLVDRLEDADFLCVRVDDRLKLRQDFIEDLKNAD